MWNNNELGQYSQQSQQQQQHHHHHHTSHTDAPYIYNGPSVPYSNTIFPSPEISGAFAPPPGPPPGYYTHHATLSVSPPGPAHVSSLYEESYQQATHHSFSQNPPIPPVHTQHYGVQTEGGLQPSFQYSQCTGKKKALCIGINYINQSAELKGCHNDARNVAKFLISHFGYDRNDVVMLLDGSANPREIPTRENILAAMRWLVEGAQPNDSLFFHYSGHGGQTKDLDGDEDDGYDEVIYPVDYKQTSHIVDDEMHMIMVKPLPSGCRLTAIFDSCHSGSALDLPYIYSTEGKIKEPNLMLEAGQGLFTAATSYMRGDMSGVIRGISSIISTGSNRKAEEISRKTRTSSADVISWSGCKDSQTSADTIQGGAATGAMSYAFIKTLSQKPNQSYQQLLISLRHILATEGYDQKPQLSSSHPMDTELMFIA